METEPGGQYGTPPAAEQRGGTDTSARVNSQAGGESLLSSEKSDFGNRSSAEGAEESFSLMGNEGDENHAAKARRQTRDEFIEVMLNPAMDYSEFARRFGTVSQRTFYRWRAHIRDWRAAIRADPQLDYARFSRHARDVPEYVFNVWREWESRMENSTSHSAGDDAEGPQVESSESSGCHSQPAPTTASQGGVSGKTTEKGKTGSKQLKLMWMAFDYYRSHPTIDFKGLTALFPSVTMDMFQQWKKGVDVRMEYIRNIPSTNFEDFNRLFPDVQENIFNIFKASVLSEKSVEESYYLSHSQSAADTTSSSCLPALQTAYSPSSQAVFPQMTEVRTSAKQDKISDTMLRGAEGEPSHQVGYLSAKPIPTQSPHLQTSPAAGGGGEGLSVATPSVVSIKQESSPNTPLPSFTETVSNLSNLSRLNAMFQHRLPPSTPAAMSATATSPAPSAVLYPHTSLTATTTTTASINSNYSTSLAGIVRDSLPKAVSATRTSTNPSPHSHTSHLYSSASSSAPLPALANPPVYHGEDGEVGGSQRNVHAQPSLGGYEDTQGGREERGMELPGHSSQRQRKLQREEYVFVVQNPDVDVQEFLTRFPGVSLRTFYRWKREIREEQQARGMIGGLG